VLTEKRKSFWLPILYIWAWSDLHPTGIPLHTPMTTSRGRASASEAEAADNCYPYTHELPFSSFAVNCTDKGIVAREPAHTCTMHAGLTVRTYTATPVSAAIASFDFPVLECRHLTEAPTNLKPWKGTGDPPIYPVKILTSILSEQNPETISFFFFKKTQYPVQSVQQKAL